MKLLILQDCVGYPDGVTRTEYAAGQTVDVPTSLAGSFVEMGCAEADKPGKVETKLELPPETTLDPPKKPGKRKPK